MISKKQNSMRMNDGEFAYYNYGFLTNSIFGRLSTIYDTLSKQEVYEVIIIYYPVILNTRTEYSLDSLTILVEIELYNDTKIISIIDRFH